MSKNLDNILEIFKEDKRINVNGEFIIGKIQELALKYDVKLINTLMSEKEIKEFFFIEVDGTYIFKREEFIDFIGGKYYLQDSYTKYKNKIGLNDGSEYIKDNRNVVLNWPYKDCVLEGGQTKEEQKRDEVFYNEVLAYDEIDMLLQPKVITNIKRYSKDGEMAVTEILDTDNLIIKGNNLLALSSLLKKYECKIKLIYIDPPYNTGKKNSFGYNDSFNHSSWLTFMKNRIQVAKKLLTPDGVLIVQTDDKEQAYLKVLLDEIFGREQFETSFYVQVRFESKTLSEDNDFHKVMEVVHVFSKSHENLIVNKIKEEYSLEKFCWDIKETGDFERIEVGGKIVDIFKDGNYAIEKCEPNLNLLKETWATGSLIRQGGTAAEFLSKYLIERKDTDGLKVLYKIHGMGEDGLGYRYVLGPQKQTAFRGKFYSGVPSKIKEAVNKGTHLKEMPIPNLIYNFLSFEGEFGNCRKEGDVDIEGGKKPEQLLKFFIEYFSNESDIILDFFAGSGSTLAAAHKMRRQYIGVEQLDYGMNDSVVRLQNVINGDSTGISKEVDWQGGGSFVYCELMKWNQIFINKIKEVNTTEELMTIWEKMKGKSFLSYRVKINEMDKNIDDFIELSLEQQKKLLVEVLDKNHLYVNLSEIDDETYNVSDKDNKINKKFYGLE